MITISIATQKGGAGKTTLATNLSVASARSGLLTLLVDADFRQRTAMEWFRKRHDQRNPLVVGIKDRQSLMNLLEAARRKNINRTYIDTPGGDIPLVNDAILHSDYVLMPCGPAGFDVSAQRVTAGIVERLGKSGSFVITKTLPRGQEGIETEKVLRGLGFDSAVPHITNLKDFRDAAICSQSVIEYGPKRRAAKEIGGLFEWVEGRLDQGTLLHELTTEVK